MTMKFMILLDIFQRLYAEALDRIWIIKTLEGDHYAFIDDWIIRGIKGECYPCKPDIF